MATVNAQVPNPPSTDLTVVGFWEATYFPFVKQERKPSTIHGYNQLGSNV